MTGRERLPDDALVVRCGKPPFSNPKPLSERCARHPEGVYGFSVQSAANVTIETLAQHCRNRHIGVTTVGAIRKLGYEVHPTSGQGRHATVEVPMEWGSEAAEELGRLFRDETNPAGGQGA
jgi:hypothetical protein